MLALAQINENELIRYVVSLSMRAVGFSSILSAHKAITEYSLTWDSSKQSTSWTISGQLFSYSFDDFVINAKHDLKLQTFSEFLTFLRLALLDGPQCPFEQVIHVSTTTVFTPI